MEPVPHRQTSSRRDGLRALVDLASGDVAGEPEEFLLPNGPHEAAALAGVGGVRQDRSCPSTVGPRAVFGIIVGVYAGVIAGIASGSASAILAAVFVVAMSWAAARALFRLLAASGTGARPQGRSIALSREDSKRIARRAGSAFAALLRAGECDAHAAFDSYHEALLALARFELAAGQAVAADRDLTRLQADDPLRSLATQMAQDKAAHAVTHRTAARAAADELQAALHRRQALGRGTLPRCPAPAARRRGN